MAVTDPVEPQTHPEDAGAMARAVADDMSAIFGSGGRSTASTPLAERSASARSAMPRWAILPVSAGTLAATIAAGIYAGNKVIVTPTATPVARVGYPVSQAVERRETGSSQVAADVIVPTPIPSPPFEPATARPVIQEASPAAVASATAVAPVPPPSALAAIPVAHRPAAATSVPPAAFSRTSRCDEDSEECLAPRIDAAEQRVARAFEQAERAGVRPRDLRGYRGEWDRARSEVPEQPRYALGLYAMITSDLYTLADEAEARDGATTR